MNDAFIRNSYYGGATDIYECYAKDLHYYDVNSLYPHAMCKPMPFEVLEKGKNLPLNRLDNFFGFLEVDIECPDNMERPVLPYRLNGRTIYPTGLFTGIYFSEELKKVIPLGYKILKIHRYIKFSQKLIFNEYINTMYKIKMNSVGPERWISKLLQNSLYGIFGRRMELIKTIVIPRKELIYYVSTSIIKTIIPIDPDKYILLVVDNLHYTLIKKLNVHLKVDVSNNNNFKIIQINVALASAITSYARIHMIPFKVDPCIYWYLD